MVKNLKLSVILPVKNQEENIKRNFTEIYNYLKKHDAEIIVVESNSTDGSLDLLKRLNKKYKFILYHTTGKGEGKAIKAGVKIASGGIIGYFDMDLAVPLKFVDGMLEAFDNGDYDIVIGNKYLKESVAHRNMTRWIASRGYNSLVKLILNSKVGDHQCGFKFYKSSFIKKYISQVKDDKCFFDCEILILAQNKKKKIYELPVEFYDREQTTLRFKDIVYFWNKIIETRMAGEEVK